MNFRGRAETQRDATARSSSDLRGNKTRRRIVFTTRERERATISCLLSREY